MGVRGGRRLRITQAGGPGSYRVSDGLDDVTAVVVNYRTRDLTGRAVETLLHHYPTLSLIVIDNGSKDESTVYVRELGKTHQNVTAVINRRNRYHGPALDQAIRIASTDLIFTLDSDCEIRRGGFLEAMLPALADNRGLSYRRHSL